MARKASRRDELARYYAHRHLQTDPGTRVVYYLPKGAPEREIRLLEVNELMAERKNDPFEPLDLGVDVDNGATHKLLVVDVTPSQWERIQKKAERLPRGWSMDGAVEIHR